MILQAELEREALEYSFNILKAVRFMFRVSIMDIISIAEHMDEAKSVFSLKDHVSPDTFRLLQRARLDYICNS
jgi:hypothetical protein